MFTIGYQQIFFILVEKKLLNISKTYSLHKGKDYIFSFWNYTIYIFMVDHKNNQLRMAMKSKRAEIDINVQKKKKSGNYIISKQGIIT